MWGKNDPVHAARLAEQGLAFGPPPAWIVERAIPRLPPDPQGSIQFPLSDTHIDLTNGRDWTYRLVQRALNADGVGRMANFTAAFDPSFERLTIHRVRIIRGDQVIDLAEPDGFQLLRRETNLERRLYDGRLTADLQVPDLRPGDTLDTWYTTHGMNPVTRSAIDARFSFEWSDPVALTAVSIRAPESRAFSIRPLPETWKPPVYAERKLPGGIVEREWIDDRGGVFRYDDAIPDWWNGHGRIEISDAFAWSDVADLFRDAYAPPAELPAGLREAVDAIATASSDPATRIVEALRHVQREVRYLSVSIGEGGYVPRPVDEIWSRRFGDCKDVSRLLCAMLRALGVDATPALVNTRAGDVINARPPGAHAFDHCIVRVRLNGKVYWLDGTFGEQGGDLEHLYQSQLGWALPMEAGARLESMAQDKALANVLHLTEVFTFGPRADSPAELRIEGVYRGWRADSMRGSIRRDGIDRHSETWVKQYAKYYGGAIALEPPRIEDDLRNNVFTLVERYRVERPWEIKDNIARFNSVDDVFGRDLTVLPYPGRTQPLYLGMPRRMTRTTQLKLPNKWQITPWLDVVDAPGIRGRSEFRIDDTSRMVLDVDYEITSTCVEPKDLEVFSTAMDKLRTGLSMGLTHAVKNGEFVKTGGSNYSGNRGALIGAGLLIAALVIIRILTAMNPG